ncbi:serine/threonine protein kinase [Promineifilum sp.]|uniref:serine/threonine protein kinase n=1 Tax=Promineifilum sp. TaxID=2664178 RepID=UPI0035AE1167
MTLQPGDILLGKYEIVSYLDKGGMATTYRAIHLQMGWNLVIKTSPDTTPWSATDKAVLKREADLMVDVRHDSLPRIYDADFSDRPIIVMEYIRGFNLKETMLAGPIDSADALVWLGQLLDALAHLHDAHIIHRDIKPSNIIIREGTRRAVLLDFGIARRLDRRGTTTLVHGLMTPDYAPIEMFLPEYLESYSTTAADFVRRLADDSHTRPATDIYGLAATFYHALTQETPTEPYKRLRRQKDPLTPPHELQERLPPHLSDVLLKALAIHPDDRYQTATAMKAALDDPAPPPPAPSPPRSELIPIPGGPYKMGSDLPGLREDPVGPCHDVALEAFLIGRYPVTNEEYRRFLEANPHKSPPTSSDPRAAPYCWDARTRHPPPGAEQLPVVLVTWQDAVDYCDWLAETTGRPYRLPTEAEWEVAASWDPAAKAARLYPWGPFFEEGRCPVGRGAPVIVGDHSPRGDSPFGLGDAVGNVWQWTSSGFWRYPYRRDGREHPDNGEQMRIVRGGAFDERERSPLVTMCPWRGWKERERRYHNVGFRVALSASDPQAQTLHL